MLKNCRVLSSSSRVSEVKLSDTGLPPGRVSMSWTVGVAASLPVSSASLSRHRIMYWPR